MQRISIISPLRNEEKNVAELCRRIRHTMVNRLPDTKYQIILIDDASTDETWKEIVHANSIDTFVSGIRLEHSVGQHTAIAIGIKHADGDSLVVMDGDLQDMPEAIPDLYIKAITGIDAVYVRKEHESQPPVKTFFSLLFNAAVRYIAGYPRIVNSTFCVITSSVASAIRADSRFDRYFPLAVAANAKTFDFINVIRPQRIQGKSNYSLRRQLSLALDALALTGKRIITIDRTAMAISLVTVFAALTFVRRSAPIYAALLTVVGSAGVITSILFYKALIRRSKMLVSYRIAERVGFTSYE